MWTLGRILYSVIFIVSGFNHFNAATIAYAAAEGVPGATVLVPVSGVMAVAGGLLVALGWRVRLGAWLLALFLLPVTLMMHAFWSVPDPQMAAQQQIEFMKNLSMLGAALCLVALGDGSALLRRETTARRERELETAAR